MDQCGHLGSKGTYGGKVMSLKFGRLIEGHLRRHGYEASKMKAHNLASLSALRAQMPTISSLAEGLRT